MVVVFNGHILTLFCNCELSISQWCNVVYRFETCWPAMAKDASGVILVSDADQMNIKDLESWFVFFSYFMKLAAACRHSCFLKPSFCIDLPAMCSLVLSMMHFVHFSGHISPAASNVGTIQHQAHFEQNFSINVSVFVLSCSLLWLTEITMTVKWITKKKMSFLSVAFHAILACYQLEAGM